MSALARVVALAATLPSVLAAFQGFNYGNTFTSGAPKMQSDFEAEFKTAQGLIGAPAGGFNSARLYTMVVSLSLGRSFLQLEASPARSKLIVPGI
jgi:glucan endo-1,3-beta-D-glucosidase